MGVCRIRFELPEYERQSAVDNADFGRQRVDDGAGVFPCQVGLYIPVQQRGHAGKEQHRDHPEQLELIFTQEEKNRGVLDKPKERHLQIPMLMPSNRAATPKPFQPMPDQISFSFSATRYSSSSSL